MKKRCQKAFQDSSSADSKPVGKPAGRQTPTTSKSIGAAGSSATGNHSPSDVAKATKDYVQSIGLSRDKQVESISHHANKTDPASHLKGPNQQDLSRIDPNVSPHLAKGLFEVKNSGSGEPITADPGNSKFDSRFNGVTSLQGAMSIPRAVRSESGLNVKSGADDKKTGAMTFEQTLRLLQGQLQDCFEKGCALNVHRFVKSSAVGQAVINQTASIQQTAGALSIARVRQDYESCKADLEEVRGKLEAAEQSLKDERKMRTAAEANLVEHQLLRRKEQQLSAQEARQASSADKASGHPRQMPITQQSPSISCSSTSREVIEAIRAEKLTDIDVPDNLVSGVNSLRAMLGRALHRLSRGLYASRSRFVAEIIQNADDCEYPPGAEPTILLAACCGALLAAHNEQGFTAPDVRALCDVGASTKQAGVAIGHKGIGFKSVFMVSDEPHVLSGDFGFKFDVATNGLFGYVVPEWVDPPSLRSRIASLPELSHPAFSPAAESFNFLSPQQGKAGTWLYLPLRDASAPPDISLPVLTPVFLRQLRRIVVVDTQAAQRTTLTLTQAPGPGASTAVIGECVEHRDGAALRVVASHSHQFTVYRQEVVVPVEECGPEDADDGEERVAGLATEVLIAFPLPATRAPQQVFTFLPVCSAGLPFAIQADFKLVASRCEVRSDSGWNRWLRGAIARAFATAMSADEKLRMLLPFFLPLEAEVSGSFWKPMVADVLAAMSNQACLRSESGQWRSADGLRTRPTGPGHSLVANHELLEACGLEFLDQSMYSAVLGKGAQTAAEILGVPVISVEEFLDSVQAGQGRGRGEEAKGGAVVDSRHAAWWRALYAHLGGSIGPQHVPRVRKAAIFPVRVPPTTAAEGMAPITAHTLTSLAAGIIFRDAPQDVHDQPLLYGALRVLRDLAPETAQQADAVMEGAGEAEGHCEEDDAEVVTQRAVKFLDMMGVRPGEPALLVARLAVMHWKGCCDSGVELVWAGLRFIRDHLREYLQHSAAIGSAQTLMSSMLPPNVAESIISDRSAGAAASKLEELRAAICLPTSLRDVATANLTAQRSLLGLRCAECVDGTGLHTFAADGTQLRIIGPVTASSAQCSDRAAAPGDAVIWEAFFHQLGAHPHPGSHLAREPWSHRDESQPSEESSAPNLQCPTALGDAFMAALSVVLGKDAEYSGGSGDQGLSAEGGVRGELSGPRRWVLELLESYTSSESTSKLLACCLVPCVGGGGGAQPLQGLMLVSAVRSVGAEHLVPCLDLERCGDGGGHGAAVLPRVLQMLGRLGVVVEAGVAAHLRVLSFLSPFSNETAPLMNSSAGRVVLAIYTALDVACRTDAEAASRVKDFFRKADASLWVGLGGRGQPRQAGGDGYLHGWCSIASKRLLWTVRGPQEHVAAAALLKIQLDPHYSQTGLQTFMTRIVGVPHHLDILDLHDALQVVATSPSSKNSEMIARTESVKISAKQKSAHKNVAKALRPQSAFEHLQQAAQELPATSDLLPLQWRALLRTGRGQDLSKAPSRACIQRCLFEALEQHLALAAVADEQGRASTGAKREESKARAEQVQHSETIELDDEDEDEDEDDEDGATERALTAPAAQAGERVVPEGAAADSEIAGGEESDNVSSGRRRLIGRLQGQTRWLDHIPIPLLVAKECGPATEKEKAKLMNPARSLVVMDDHPTQSNALRRFGSQLSALDHEVVKNCPRLCQLLREMGIVGSLAVALNEPEIVATGVTHDPRLTETCQQLLQQLLASPPQARELGLSEAGLRQRVLKHRLLDLKVFECVHLAFNFSISCDTGKWKGGTPYLAQKPKVQAPAAGVWEHGLVAPGRQDRLLVCPVPTTGLVRPASRVLAEALAEPLLGLLRCVGGGWSGSEKPKKSSAVSTSEETAVMLDDGVKFRPPPLARLMQMIEALPQSTKPVEAPPPAPPASVPPPPPPGGGNIHAQAGYPGLPAGTAVDHQGSRLPGFPPRRPGTHPGVPMGPFAGRYPPGPPPGPPSETLATPPSVPSSQPPPSTKGLDNDGMPPDAKRQRLDTEGGATNRTEYQGGKGAGYAGKGHNGGGGGFAGQRSWGGGGGGRSAASTMAFLQGMASRTGGVPHVRQLAMPGSQAGVGQLRAEFSGAPQGAVRHPNAAPALVGDKALEAGRAAEAFVFLYLQRTCSGFGIQCWRSSARMHFFPQDGTASLDDALGYDMEYHDMRGEFSPLGPATCCIEVKACSVVEGGVEFHMSANELERAKAMHAEFEAMRAAGSRPQTDNNGLKLPNMYVIMLVANVLVQPRIVGALFDPGNLLDGREGFSVWPDRFRVRCAEGALHPEKG
ncbi:hypothetical protein CYMTET_11841 [Cymbomonas tetramitiformis]|uniref:Sacsin/Nov domain-containing protein n=1 Tax=Cymbomonas tetramitiformis TaxID=36881 RepID=A0AAE0GMX3_9CHLO|nr:hypothetical protein CYMTET_11841 [Cymbomonas tetramitiformis]